jgi:hypothetical protein
MSFGKVNRKLLNERHFPQPDEIPSAAAAWTRAQARSYTNNRMLPALRARNVILEPIAKPSSRSPPRRDTCLHEECLHDVGEELRGDQPCQANSDRFFRLFVYSYPTHFHKFSSKARQCGAARERKNVDEN